MTKTVTCNIGTIAPGATVNVQITVKPRSEGLQLAKWPAWTAYE